MPKGDKKFLGYVLEKDPMIDMWFNGGPGEVSIALNKHSSVSWSVTVSKGNVSLTGGGNTERAAREDLTRRMHDYKSILECFDL